MPKHGDGTSKEPIEWFTSGEWRKAGPFDAVEAQNLRVTLRTMGFLPMRNVDDEPTWNTLEANYRVTVSEVVADLSRTDFIAVWRVARLLGLSGRQRAPQGPLFDYVRSLEMRDG